MRGRKASGDCVVSFRPDGVVIVLSHGKTLRSNRSAPMGASAWLIVHALGMTAYDGDEFEITAKRKT